MADLHDELISEVSKELGISKHEASRIVAAEFKVIEQVITNKECKVINCIGLGKFYPTTYRRKLEDGKVTGNSCGMD